MLKNKTIHILALAVLFAIPASISAQVNFKPIFTQIRLEARADFDFYNTTSTLTTQPEQAYGFHGRYFNLVIGGPIGEKFSYFFRQRIVAKPGTVNLFDNTDFLYINYMPSKNWMIRLGKDALAVGGVEYDAPPINVLFSTHYWDNFYCFQPAVAAAFKSDDGKQMVLGQAANSPYVYYGAPLGTGIGNEWKSGLMAYSLFWNGQFGHFKVLHSVNLFQRPDRNYMNYIALGHLIEYKRWDLYLDLIHHANGWRDWGKNFAVVSCANLYLDNGLNFFVKGAYEQNRSDEVLPDFGSARSIDLGFYDCLVEAGHTYVTYGVGAEYRPRVCPDFRLHAFVANRRTSWSEAPAGTVVENGLQANAGITWDMNIHRMIKERLEKSSL